MKKKETAVTTVASEEALAELRQNMPSEPTFTRIQLPRLGMYSQDVTEGKGKQMKVISEAGTFFLDQQTEEEDKEGKKIWEKTELGNEVEGIIFFQRKQLRYYDESTETYTSSPVYDEESDIIPLFCNHAEVAKGTPAELKALPEYQYEKDGKIKSKLEDNRILYVLYEGEVYQMNLRGSSMYAWMTYARKVLVPGVLTVMNSEAKSKGSIDWNQMTFEKVRDITGEEATLILEKQKEVKEAVEAEKNFYASMNASAKKSKDELDKF